MSPTDSGMASPTSESGEVTDHYAILELTPEATTDEIRAAYRRLRSVYFANDAKKYRALQAGFDCLMDPEARQAYDATYQPAAPTSLSSIDEILDQGKHWRKDSAHGDDPAVIPEEEEEEEEEQQVRTDDPNWGLKRFQPILCGVLGGLLFLCPLSVVFTKRRFTTICDLPLSCYIPKVPTLLQIGHTHYTYSDIEQH